jgi:serine/threonine protein kinase
MLMAGQDLNSRTSLNHDSDADKTRYAVKATASVEQQSIQPLAEKKVIKQRYKLEAKIGSGGMSDIYRATDLFLEGADISNNTVAIKALQPQFVSLPEARQLLLHEANSTKQLSHPNIVRVFDVDYDQQHYFIVMEYLDGESLEQVIKRYKPKGLSFNAALKLLQPIADALSYAHRSGIVHADLKPANIMVNRDGLVKILDFGVAQKLQLNYDIYAADIQQTGGQLSGYTPAYASPQLLADNPPTVSDDVFSFACLTYELLSSKHPFDRLPANQAQQQQKVLKKPAHLSFLQWQALKQALNFDAAKRPKSIAALMQQLHRSIWQPSLITASIIIALVGGWHYSSQQQQLIAHYQQQATVIEQQQQFTQQLSQIPANQFIELLNQQPGQLTAVERAGVIRLQQAAVVRQFEHQIDNLISDRSYTYPDYPRIEAILAQAKQLYPDSEQLTALAVNMQRSKNTAIEVLRGQLNQLLMNQQFQQHPENPEALTPFKIVASLKRIDGNYRVMPNEAEAEIYAAAFFQAVDTNDAIALEQLINVGQLIFANFKMTADLVLQGEQLATAVAEVAKYREKAALGDEITFPYSAAEIFYQHSFNKLELALEQSVKISEIDAIYSQLKAFNTELPQDFSLHVAMRRKLADKYLAKSSELLKTNQVRTAERLMRRANELMNSLNS